MYQRTLSLSLLYLLASPAFATFELKDPAAEFAADTPEANAAILEAATCHDFLLQGAKKSGDYDKTLVRVYRYYRDQQAGGESPPTEAGLKKYCIDHPKDSIKDATDAQIDERL